MELTIKTPHLTECYQRAAQLAENGENCNEILLLLDGRKLTAKQARELFSGWDQVHPDGPKGKDVTYPGFRLLTIDGLLDEFTDGTFQVNASGLMDD